MSWLPYQSTSIRVTAPSTTASQPSSRASHSSLKRRSSPSNVCDSSWSFTPRRLNCDGVSEFRVRASSMMTLMMPLLPVGKRRPDERLNGHGAGPTDAVFETILERLEYPRSPYLSLEGE